jgi:hypothetical protein
LTDDTRKEINIYDEDGYRIPRRRPLHRRQQQPCGILLDLIKVRSLFDAPAQRSRDNDDNGNDNDNDYDNNDIINDPQDEEPVKLTVYPQALTKFYGHIQAHGVPYDFKPLIRSLNRTLATNADSNRPVIRAVAFQGYNAVQHNLTERAGRLEVVQGRLTAALAGTHSSSTTDKARFIKIKRQVVSHPPYARVREQLTKTTVGRAMRFEIVIIIDLHALKEEHRTGRYVNVSLVLILCLLNVRSLTLGTYLNT